MCIVNFVDLSLMSVILTMAFTPNILSYVHIYIYIYMVMCTYVHEWCAVYTQIHALHSKFIREKPFIY